MTMKHAVERCRAFGPVLVHATCTRPYSHSLSDDERLYKPKAERDAETTRDPLVRYPEWLRAEGILDTHGVEMLMHQVDLEIQEATVHALKAAPPVAGEALRFLYSDRVDPASSEFETEPNFDANPRTMVDAITLTLNEE